jgi:hypothetical protein
VTLMAKVILVLSLTRRARSTDSLVCEHCAAVHRDAREVAVTERHYQLANVAEYAMRRCGDDKLVNGRAREAAGVVKYTLAYMVYELAIQAQDDHSAATVDHCDGALVAREARAARRTQKATAAAVVVAESM